MFIRKGRQVKMLSLFSYYCRITSVIVRCLNIYNLDKFGSSIISRKTLLNEWNVPEKLMECFPRLLRSVNSQDPVLYLKRDVIKILSCYNRLKVSERNQWIKQQETKINKFQLENEKYNNLHDQTRYDHTERLERLLIKLHE